MATSSTFFLRRFASTFFVFIALFVACMGVQALPYESDSGHEPVAEHVVALATDDGSPSTDGDDLPSIEDNSGGLDDTFDVPTEHTLTVRHFAVGGHGHMAPAPHAHHPSLD